MLEAEILRLNHLRDRASEKGHKKEYPLLFQIVSFYLIFEFPPCQFKLLVLENKCLLCVFFLNLSFAKYLYMEIHLRKNIPYKIPIKNKIKNIPIEVA